MTSVKTAISLDKELFAETEEFARDQKMSRSAVVARALREMFAKYTREELVARINTALEGDNQEEELRTARAMKRLLRRRIDDEW